MARFWPLPTLTTTKLTTRMYGVDYFLGEPIGLSRDTTPTRQHEELPLPEFQRLLRQGKIEQTETYSPYNGHEETVYRLV